MKLPPIQRTSVEGVVFVSIAVFAWNEEETIRRALESLFEQSLFSELSDKGLACELICVLNGCEDRTAEVCRAFFEERGPLPDVRFRVCDLPQKGKLNAWNQFVHVLSAPESRYLIFLDADIVLHLKDTLWNTLSLLTGSPEASVAVDRPRKHLEFKEKLTLRERLSLQMGQITRGAEAQLCAQLYCMRAEVARRIYLPKDLPACEDGFIKALVCTGFLEHEPQARLLQCAPNAEHIFEAYTSLPMILKNQKRQALAQVVVHVLIDEYLSRWTPEERLELASRLMELDTRDSLWLRRLIAEHLAHNSFFKLCPGYMTTSLRRWARMPLAKRVLRFPAALAGSALAAAGTFMAWRALKAGSIDYWPKAERHGVLAKNRLAAPVLASAVEK